MCIVPLSHDCFSNDVAFVLLLQKTSSIEAVASILPSTKCLAPKEVLAHGIRTEIPGLVLMDTEEFSSPVYQRPYQYLLRYARNENLDTFFYQRPGGSPRECIEILLKYCSLTDPTWSELRHFASFLNCQLRDCEQSVFCDANLVGADSGLVGFKKFVVKFMIRMSQDFATPSLNVNEPAASEAAGEHDVFELHQLRRRWEESSHPYLFFNEDRVSMSFVNFKINLRGDLLCQNTNQCLEPNVMGKNLVQGLGRQGVNLNENFDRLTRAQKLRSLRNVLGIDDGPDPDPTYELTTDNVLKMLAIHMRFRCNIPVVVMGETGCGKTRMVEFMSKLKAGKQKQIPKPAHNQHPQSDAARNMMIVKVHGGITVRHIQQHMRRAVELATTNQREHGIDTILFLDEANTTEAVYAIKEFVCDGSIHGKSVEECGLRIVAACNPYRKHSQEAIDSMEAAGLGFRVKTDDTVDKLGEIPMRCLVYRVIALPPSMQPLVWDFGQLQNHAERKYIEQMIQRLGEERLVPLQQDLNMIVDVLARSQAYMRSKRNECHFVSLRDVERCLVSFKWFRSHASWLFPEVDEEKNSEDGEETELVPIVRCLIHAVGMCYHVTLGCREDYRQMVSDVLSGYGQNVTDDEVLDEIVACQSVFLKHIDLDDDVARNEALRENVFMMIMCTEMRIPLFLIGKPGSSKSLAKTVVTAAMQGLSSANPVFKRLKQIQVLSFQCSPVSDAMGIEGVFRQCLKLQETQDTEKFVAVAVLDEVGLAEDSPKMPLKVLHPLLESGTTDGSTGSASDLITKEKDTQKRVGFVGISNWALDPAKMNRGVFVHRGAPTKEDLKLTARGIFTSDEKGSFEEVARVVDAVTESYWKIYDQQEKQQEEAADDELPVTEFFGLRDYYGLLKMIFSIVCEKVETLSAYHVAYAVLRNFSGSQKNYIDVFWNNLETVYPGISQHCVSLEQMVKDNLEFADKSESRYVLLMSNHFAAFDLLSQIVDTSGFQVIFGSSFPQDNNYTEVCRNINRIKMCMESGQTVVLLNLRDLYESLYDALNQHYVTFAGQRYVDLGLGGHRVKCRVAENFRLIVIEDMDVVYNEFPIPLINRLEKHIFTTSSILNSFQKAFAVRLQEWAAMFSDIKLMHHQRNNLKTFSVHDAFVGYTNDTAASAVIAASCERDVFGSAQHKLLLTATMDSLFRLRKSKIPKEAERWQEMYRNQQCHDNLLMLLADLIKNPTDLSSPQILDIVTFSQILSESDRQKLEQALELPKRSIMLLTLQQFQTASEYAEKVNAFLSQANGVDTLEDSLSDKHLPPFYALLIQCPQAHGSANLTACAKYTVQNLLRSKVEGSFSGNCRLMIAFLHTLERDLGVGNQMKSFFSSRSSLVYVDELRILSDYIAIPTKLWKMSLLEIFQGGFRFLESGQERHVYGSTLEGSENPLDLKRLINNCVTTAIVKLRTDAETRTSSRIGKLVSLFSNQDIVSRQFIHGIAKHVRNIIEQRENETVSSNSWMVDEASSHTSLNEGGSLTKTLWLYLKKLTSTTLAYVISKVDPDKNLDLLWAPDDSNITVHLKKIWLMLFDSNELCQFKWRDISSTPDEFVVMRKEGFNAQFPFSRKIIDIFDKHWDAFQHADQAKQMVMFHKRIETTRLNNVLRDTESSCTVEVLKCFIHDLIHLRYQAGSGEPLEIQLVQNVLFEIFKTKQMALEHSAESVSNLIACVFVLSKTEYKFLRQIAQISHVLPSIITESNVTAWSKGQEGNTKVITQFLMFRVALEHIKALSDAMKISEEYRHWTNVIGQLRSTAHAIMLQQQGIEHEKVWRALEFADLFLDQLIPQGLPPELYNNYVDLLIPLSRRLWKGASKKEGLRTEKFLNIVVKVLSGCSKDVRLKHLLNWRELSCKLCRKLKVVEPIVLPCEHYMCLACWENSVAPGTRQCPICREEISDDFEITPSQLTAQQAEEVETFRANCTSFFLEFLSTLCFPAPGTDASDLRVDANITEALHKLVIVEKSTKELSPLETSSFDDTPTVRSFILQLLLRYNQDKIEADLEKHFTRFGSVLKDTHELMMIYIQCIEDALQNKSMEPDKLLSLLGEQIRLRDRSAALSQVPQLNLAANLRFAVEYISRCIFADMTENKRKHEQFIVEAVGLLQDVNHCKQYFVKFFCRRFGISYFPELLLNDQARLLVPHTLQPQDDDSSDEAPDSLLVAGETYASAKRVVEAVKSDESIEQAVNVLLDIAKQSPNSCAQVLLAAFSFVHSSHGNSAGELITMLEKRLKEVQNTELVLRMFSAFKSQDPPLPRVSPLVQKAVHTLAAEVCFTVSTSKDCLMTEMTKMLLDPSLFDRQFLPTMPQSIYFDDEVKSIVGGWVEHHSNGPPKEYLCPNGHPYYIGDCTNPVQVNFPCPDCKAPIGANQKGVLHVGNRAGKLDEQSQAGYKLRSLQAAAPPAVVPERECNRTSVCVLRFILHAAMIAAPKTGIPIRRY